MPIGIQILKGLACWALLMPADSMGTGRSSLLDNNPFLGPTTVKTPAEQGSSIEWCGVVVEGRVTWFIFHDTTTNKWTTVRQGEEGAPFLVRSYDRAQDAVVLDVQGRRVTLGLKSGGSQSFGRTASAADVASAIPRQNAKPTIVVPAPSPDENRRLDQVSAVIRMRRKEIKRQAAQPGPTRS